MQKVIQYEVGNKKIMEWIKMKKITLKHAVMLMQRTLDSMDDRLQDHGEKVAYIMYQLLKSHGGYSQEDVIKMTMMALFHDIGVYKIEEREKILAIESEAPRDHAVYGYFFIKYFSPLSDSAEIVLGHHLYPKDMSDSGKIKIPKEALLLNLADRIAIWQLQVPPIDPMCILDMDNQYILEEHRTLFEKACRDDHFLEKIQDDRYLEELYEILDQVVLTRKEMIDYVRMLICTIDFRSEATLLHNITVEEISFQIAKLMGIDEQVATRIKIAAMLHDIGKLFIPISILEKEGRLTKEEFEVIKNHAIIGYRILSGMGIDDLRDIATLHHEKLNGKGYPFGLKGDQISKEARIVAIADVLSALIGKRSYKEPFSKEKVISILLDMVSHNEIDADICQRVVDHYDLIIERVTANTKDTIYIYKHIMDEYEDTLEMMSQQGCQLK